jgi:TolB-like protein/Tfp pilus assembly protein PilF
MNLRNFFSELKRRNVYKVAVAYAVVGWLLVQVATQVCPVFEIPNWAVRLIVLVIVIGCPIALVIAWAFELTPQGIKRTDEIDALVATNAGVASEAQTKSHVWIYVALVGAILSIGLFMLGRYGFHDPRPSSNELPAKSIAVLPFENLSRDPDNAYFVDGIQDEILTRLAKISALKVISRTSTMRYASRPDNLREIAKQLGVANILEGSVQRAAGAIRVNVQLIKTDSDSHLWAETYDRDIKNVFSVESEIAQQVADALKATLLPAESARITNVPTKNPAAYDLFLKGQYFFNQLQTSASKDPVADGKTAIEIYRHAVKADPRFALAYARLSYLESYLHWYGADNSTSVIDDARADAKQALGLEPDLPEAHLAMGYVHYWCFRDYAAALQEFAIAHASLPNDAEVLAAIGYVHRRQGLSERGIPELEQAMVLDPRNTLIPREIANSYTALRRYSEADAAYARSLAIFPGDIEAHEQRAASLMYSGDMAEAARILAAIPADTDPQGSVSLLRYKLAITTRQPDVALAALAHSPDWLMTRWEHSLVPLTLLRAQALALKGEAGPARDAFLRSEQELQTLLDKPHEVADAQSYLGLVYAGLGQKEAALKAAHAAVDLLPMTRDVIVGAFYLERLARVETQVGETDSAIKHIDQLLSSSGGETISLATLRIDPAWDPIRADPRFKVLLAKYAASEKQAAR